MSMVGLVLGSGLGTLVERMQVAEALSFGEVGLPGSTVPGHEGRMVRGSLAGREIWAMQGRVHLYEGYGAEQVTAGIRWMHERGVNDVILTNAAGSLDGEREPGSWMMLEDHLNLTGASPLEGGANFVDLSEVYDGAWREQVKERAREHGMVLHEGVYAGVRGPQYETPAEVRMLGRLGADAVGMSTVLEAIQARALGMRVLGFSCLTNQAAGLPGAKLDHGEVVATGRRAARQMEELLEALLGDCR